MTNDRSAADVARELGLSVAKVYQMAAAGEVAHQRYGRTVRFTAEQVTAIREQFQQPAVSSRRLRRAS